MQGEQPTVPPTEEPTAEPVATTSLRIPVDPEPVALRLTLILLLVVGTFLGYWLVSAIVPGQALNLLALAGGFVIGGGIMWASEKALKPNWPATRFVEIKPDAVNLLRRGKIEQTVDPAQHVNVLTWSFEIDKRAHVPRGWHMIALALEQDDLYIPVYTFVPPESFEAWNRSTTFTRLEKRKDNEKANNSERRDLRAAGAQRRLRMAEGARVFLGAEMTEPNFRTYLQRLTSDYPAWMPEIDLPEAGEEQQA